MKFNHRGVRPACTLAKHDHFVCDGLLEAISLEGGGLGMRYTSLGDGSDSTLGNPRSAVGVAGMHGMREKKLQGSIEDVTAIHVKIGETEYVCRVETMVRE